MKANNVKCHTNMTDSIISASQPAVCVVLHTRCAAWHDQTVLELPRHLQIPVPPITCDTRPVISQVTFLRDGARASG